MRCTKFGPSGNNPSMAIKVAMGLRLAWDFPIKKVKNCFIIKEWVVDYYCKIVNHPFAIFYYSYTIIGIF